MSNCISILTMNFRKTAVGIVVNKNGEVLICRSPRHDNVWKFPQGGIENNEEYAQALKREIKEELNIDINDNEVSKMYPIVSYFFSNGFEIKLHPFLVRLHRDVEVTLDPEEFDLLRWINPEEVNTLDLGVRKDAYISILTYMNLLPKNKSPDNI